MCIYIHIYFYESSLVKPCRHGFGIQQLDGAVQYEARPTAVEAAKKSGEHRKIYGKTIGKPWENAGFMGYDRDLPSAYD